MFIQARWAAVLVVSGVVSALFAEQPAYTPDQKVALHAAAERLSDNATIRNAIGELIGTTAPDLVLKQVAETPNPLMTVIAVTDEERWKLVRRPDTTSANTPPAPALDPDRVVFHNDNPQMEMIEVRPEPVRFMVFDSPESQTVGLESESDPTKRVAEISYDRDPGCVWIVERKTPGLLLQVIPKEMIPDPLTYGGAVELLRTHYGLDGPSADLAELVPTRFLCDCDADILATKEVLGDQVTVSHILARVLAHATVQSGSSKGYRIKIFDTPNINEELARTEVSGDQGTAASTLIRRADSAPSATWTVLSY